MPRIFKKRKGFHGVRKWQLEGPSGSSISQQSLPSTSACTLHAISSQDGPRPTPESYTPTRTTKELTSMRNMSAEKLSNSDFKKMDNQIRTRSKSKKLGVYRPLGIEDAHGTKLQDFSLLNACLENFAICSSCRSGKSTLKIKQNNQKRRGLAEFLFIICTHCGAKQDFTTSKKISGKGGAFEINRKAVLACPSRAQLQSFCTNMDLPPPVTKESHNNHLKEIEQKVKLEAEEKMKDAADHIFSILKVEEPERIKVTEDGQEIGEIPVTVDGTWQKRGHTSKIGVVFVLSVRSGEVLDYEVLSHFCQACLSHNSMNKDSHEFKEWQAMHADHCEINHFGSSGDMESQGAIAIFKRSIIKRRLKYTHFIGDGDSSCFGKVATELRNTYGDSYTIQKEECVGHVQKRLGYALLQYKKGMKGQQLKDGKGVGGAGRLTQDTIKKIQNYYGLAIRQNKGNLQDMKTAIQAILHHIIDDPKKSLTFQHKYCPKGEDSWCQFQKDVANGTKIYTGSNRLPGVFLNDLEPIFSRLSDDTLLKRCLLGLTQNQNESLNGRLWSSVPKAQFCGKRCVHIGVCKSICSWNTGSGSKSTVMQKLGVMPGSNALSALRNEDEMRLRNAARKISLKYRQKRKSLRLGRKRKHSASVAYKAGGFGLDVEPVLPRKRKPTIKQESKTKPIQKNDSTGSNKGGKDPEVLFVNEDDISQLSVQGKKP